MHTGENFMLLIQNSYLIDPASGTEGRRDILIDHGRFVKIEKHLMAPAGASVLDASGMIVCPGLIDISAIPVLLTRKISPPARSPR